MWGRSLWFCGLLGCHWLLYISTICTLIACVRFLYVWMSIFLMDDTVSVSGSVCHVLSIVSTCDVWVLLFLVLGMDVAVARSFVLMNSLRAVRGVLCGSTPLCFSLVDGWWGDGLCVRMIHWSALWLCYQHSGGWRLVLCRCRAGVQKGEKGTGFLQRRLSVLICSTVAGRV